jgi:hypothetical protein
VYPPAIKRAGDVKTERYRFAFVVELIDFLVVTKRDAEGVTIRSREGKVGDTSETHHLL